MKDRLQWVNFKRLHADAVIPKYQTEGAAGFDFHAVEDVEIYPGETALVKTGLAFEIPAGFEIQVRPRSGNSLKTRIRIANSPGTIDSDYRGEVGIIVDNLTKGSMPVLRGLEKAGVVEIKKGDRIAQGVLVPVFTAFFVEKEEELNETQRGSGGFGSTNKAKKS